MDVVETGVGWGGHSQCILVLGRTMSGWRRDRKAAPCGWSRVSTRGGEGREGMGTGHARPVGCGEEISFARLCGKLRSALAFVRCPNPLPLLLTSPYVIPDPNLQT